MRRIVWRRRTAVHPAGDVARGGGIKLLINLDGDARADETILFEGLTSIARDDLILA